ncbi:DUF6716 putative glycosyltransferase [Demequina aurantiaca]|uniref:DUF6716 putative glycosyltransferase n=1 Tax=Demequina aurantiaca TaxID=676200 RepID=UPI003D33B3D7
MRVLVLADSDSYLKWAVTRARELPSEWRVEVAVLANAVTPSARQRADAVAGRWVDVPVISVAAAEERINAGLDVLLLACRGPLIEFLFEEVLGQMSQRPAVVAGIPGLWFPPTRRGLDFRADVDLLVVHSRREREAVDAANPSGGPQVALAALIEGERPVRPHWHESEADVSGSALAKVPTHSQVQAHSPTRRHTLSDASAAPAAPAATRGAGAIIFAPQALVPSTRAERVTLLDGLVRTAVENPSVPVLVKLRGEEGEAQTHSEFASYPELARQLRVERPRNLRFVQGPLSEHLEGARGLVTVSSTAALEAVGAAVPTMVLGDFGVSALNLNEVFRGSGLWGDLDRLARLDFPQVDTAWKHDNYFHEAHESNWVDAVTCLAEDRALLESLRASRPHSKAPDGARGRIRRLRVRSQALGRSDERWRRWLTALVLRPALAIRALLVRGDRPRRPSTKLPD